MELFLTPPLLAQRARIKIFICYATEAENARLLKKEFGRLNVSANWNIGL